MNKKETIERIEVKKALNVLLKWFVEKNRNAEKPITMLEGEFGDENEPKVRLITFFVLSGRDDYLKEVVE